VFILFVEYYSAFRQAASYMLDHEADLEVVSQAGQVAEGRQKIAEVGIDAAIVNIRLPYEGAAELVRELHEANASIPVLVMSTFEDEEVREEFHQTSAREGRARYGAPHLRGDPRRGEETGG
jgi:DNA-binding NarL/FixJ family response regulator